MEKKAGKEKLTVPEEFDWRQKDQNRIISEVKDQGKCGCCWATVTIGVMQAMCFIEKGKIVKPSAQDHINCVSQEPKEQDEMGCYAVKTHEVLSWVLKCGCVSESSCPYKGKRLPCF